MIASAASLPPGRLWIDLPEGASAAILTDAEARAAEQRLFNTGVPPYALMELAGGAVARIIADRFPGRSLLVGCGPGNNGGDGYVIARHLRERGFAVRIAALAEPRTEAARLAAARWNAPIEPMTGTPRGADIFVDALFGIGQSRPLDPQLAAWVRTACGERAVIVDVPSGIRTDTGEGAMAVVAPTVLTIAIGAFKPAHLLGEAVARTTELALAPIGLPIDPDHPLGLLRSHALRPPDASANKYARGKAVIVGGQMAGAAHLAAIAAQRSGAGYVELVLDDAPLAPPYALVRRDWSDDVLADPRIGAVAIGPGLLDLAQSRTLVEAVLRVDRPVVFDAGALAILKGLGLESLRGAASCRVLTPHEGEFARLFGPIGTDRIAAVRDAARRSGAIVVLKGNVTIVADPDGRAAMAPPASPWLATAGTGDVLTGIVAAMLAQMPWHGLAPFAAVSQAVWLHARAADLAGPVLIADDLLAHLPRAVTEA